MFFVPMLCFLFFVVVFFFCFGLGIHQGLFWQLRITVSKPVLMKQIPDLPSVHPQHHLGVRYDQRLFKI